MATSLAGVSGAGTLLDRPTTPVRAMRSMFGLWAACNGVLPPRDSCGFVGAAVGDDDGVLHAGSVGLGVVRRPLPKMLDIDSRCAIFSPLA